jgi:hypothetical protein
MSAAATIGATVASVLPFGSPSALAAHANHESAPQLLSSACSATVAASAFRAQGHVNTGGTEISVDLYFGSAGELMTITQHGDQTLNAIVSGSSTYFKANRSFWQSATKSSGAASLLEGRWIDMTADQKDASSLTNSLTKGGVLSQCGHGSSATYSGGATVAGTKVIKVHQNARDGSKPESNTYFIKNGSTPYILRVTGSEAQKDSGNLVFTSFGVQPNTSAPPGAIPISQFK